jgi:hypothetical protein
VCVYIYIIIYDISIIKSPTHAGRVYSCWYFPFSFYFMDHSHELLISGPEKGRKRKKDEEKNGKREISLLFSFFFSFECVSS